MNPSRLTRREFLRRASLVSGLGAAAPWALNLAAIGEAAAQSAGDYRAIVCVFLYGGNDHANTLPPYDIDNYNRYLAIRPTIATARDLLVDTILAPANLPSGMQFALAPQLAAIRPLFDEGRLGVLLNIGPLIQPTTKAQYQAQNVPLPPKLFSHNDQQSVWQSSLPEGATSGWGGRIGDLFLSGNGNATFTCINASGNAVYMAGQQAIQYQVNTSTGAVALLNGATTVYGSRAAADALRTLISTSRPHQLESAHATVAGRALATGDQLRGALPPASGFTRFDTTNPLEAQLQMVARIIAARSSLGASRQVFFVSIGGFDNHDFLLDQHPGLLGRVGNALAAFYRTTVDLGVASQVTSFTASDFGRTLTSNGDGSDHGWGSHHFVLGGAVQGGRFYGRAPAVANNGPDDVGQGRLLPSTSVDQFAATLAAWMGVPASDLARVVPNIVNFGARDLGLFA